MSRLKSEPARVYDVETGGFVQKVKTVNELYGDLQERVRSARRSAGDDGGGGGDGAHNGGASGEAPAVEAAARGASSEEGSCAVQ